MRTVGRETADMLVAEDASGRPVLEMEVYAALFRGNLLFSFFNHFKTGFWSNGASSASAIHEHLLLPHSQACGVRALRLLPHDECDDEQQ